jgi:5S rRNA maturation endonuclease (ribonuclease M5)
MNPTAEQIISFLNDEGLSSTIKIRQDDGPFFKISINDPWSPDNKLRCSIALTQPDWAEEPVVLFNTYKSALLFGEEYKGSFWKFVMLIKGFGNLNEARIWFLINYMFHGDIKKNIMPQPKIERVVKKKQKVTFPEHFVKLDINKHQEYTKYLLDRKLSIWRIKDLELFVDLKEKRIVFPVYENGEMIYWTGRSIINSTLRWKNAQCTSWPHPIWNLDNIKSENSVYIFEAIFDALTVYNGIAILGASNIQEEQIEKIINKNFSRIVVIMDNDVAGEKTRMELAKTLSQYHNNVWIYDFKGIKQKDFNQMAQEEIDFDFDNRLNKYGLKAQLAKQLKIIQ